MRELAPQSDTGAFVRASYAYHHDIGIDPDFPIEAGRYHVYLGNACPWCHRVALAVTLLGLEEVISVGEVVDDPEKASRGGWVFNAMQDPVTGCSDLREVYDKCCGERDGFRGRCTAPLLIDKKQMRIVSNESARMIRNFNDMDFNGATDVDLRPKALCDAIDALNGTIYDKVNNGVYKCGFATSQAAYDAASDALFSELTQLNARLAESRFLLGDKFTECDLRLYPTVIRFDPIYATVFHCSKTRLHAFPNLLRWLRDVYRIEIPSARTQIADTIDLADARRSYCELFPLNPSGIVFAGADLESLELRRSPPLEINKEPLFFPRRTVAAETNVPTL